MELSSLPLSSVFIAVIGLTVLVIALVQLIRRRWFAGLSLGVVGVVVSLAALVVVLFASNLRTYHRLVYESPVAQISFEQIAGQRYKAELINVRSGKRRDYELAGNEWQLDALIITWHGLATVMGLDPRYQLQRLSGRYSAVDQELSEPRTVYNLVSDEVTNVWSFVREYQQWISWVDVTYGTAVYVPMADGASYSVSISRSGLVVRPENFAAQQALGLWQKL